MNTGLSFWARVSRPACLVSCAALIPAAFGSAFGDVLFFRNQRYVKGTLEGQTQEGVVFRTVDGRTLRIPKRQILRIVYQPLEEDRSAAELLRAERERERQLALREKEARERQAEEKRREQERREAARRLAFAREQARSRATLERERGRRWEALQRSAAFPGWGQAFLGRESEGRWTAGAAAGLILLFVWRHERWKAEMRSYETAARSSTLIAVLGAGESVPHSGSFNGGGWLAAYGLLDGPRRDTRRVGAQVGQMGSLLGVLYLASLARTWFLGGAPQSSAARQAAAQGAGGWSFVAGNDGMPAGLSFALRF